MIIAVDSVVGVCLSQSVSASHGIEDIHIEAISPAVLKIFKCLVFPALLVGKERVKLRGCNVTWCVMGDKAVGVGLSSQSVGFSQDKTYLYMKKPFLLLCFNTFVVLSCCHVLLVLLWLPVNHRLSESTSPFFSDWVPFSP